MYDELARAQKPGYLERFVVNALIPSVVLTSRENAHFRGDHRPKGRVLAPSILVVFATNPGFVAPARQVLRDVVSTRDGGRQTGANAGTNTI